MGSLFGDSATPPYDWQADFVIHHQGEIPQGVIEGTQEAVGFEVAAPLELEQSVPQV